MVYGPAADRTRLGLLMQERLAERGAELREIDEDAARIREEEARNPQRCGRRMPNTPGHSCGAEPLPGAVVSSPDPSAIDEAAAYWLCAEHTGELQGFCRGDASKVAGWLDDNVMPGWTRSGPHSLRVLEAAVGYHGDE